MQGDTTGTRNTKFVIAGEVGQILKKKKKVCTSLGALTSRASSPGGGGTLCRWLGGVTMEIPGGGGTPGPMASIQKRKQISPNTLQAMSYLTAGYDIITN